MNAKIYVADLAAYNSGHLHGVWVDVSSDADEMNEKVQAMLAASPVPDAEEYAIHDTDGIDVGEYTSLSDVAAIVERIEKLEDYFTGEDAEEIYAAFCECFGDPEKVEDVIEAYRGHYSSERDYAERFVEDAGYLDLIPDSLQFYFDYDAFARDLFINDVVMSGRGYVFDRNW